MNNSISIRTKFGLQAVPYNQQTENHLLIELTGNESESTAKRPPIEAVLCLDTSPSMNSQKKMPLAKKSAIAMIDNMRDGDALAIVFFSGNSQVVMPFTVLDAGSKKLATEKIQSAYAGGGGTNVSGAIIDAFEAFRSFESDPNATRRVIFLTDGNPTTGETRNEKLVEMASQTPEGVLLTTMGFGEAVDNPTFGGMGGELNTVLLQEMANKGKGNYYYMADGDSCRNAFANELAGLLSCVGQDISVRIKPQANRIKLEECLDNVDVEVDGDDFLITIPDLLEGEKRHLLIRTSVLKQQKAWARASKVAEINVSYKDASKASIVKLDENVKLGIVNKAKATKDVDTEVETQIKVIEAIKAQQDAIGLAQSGNLAGAQQAVFAAAAALDDVGSVRGMNIAASLRDAGALYNDQQSFVGNKNTLLATSYSMSTGRASGGLADDEFSNAAQKEMQDKFAISDDGSDEDTQDSQMDAIQEALKNFGNEPITPSTPMPGFGGGSHQSPSFPGFGGGIPFPDHSKMPDGSEIILGPTGELLNTNKTIEDLLGDKNKIGASTNSTAKGKKSSIDRF